MTAALATPSSARPLDVFTCPLRAHALIEASAGTGKTWAICGLVLRLIVEKNLPIREILVVTFTKAATAELRARIRARLVETLAALAGKTTGNDPFVSTFLKSLHQAGLDDAQIGNRLNLALTAFDEAAIFTIHGFCQRALSEAPFAAAQPFSLELLEDDSLTREAVLDFWRQHIAGADFHPAFAAWLSGCLKPDLLLALVKRQLHKPLAAIRWPAALDQAGGLPPIETDTRNALRQQARQYWQTARHDIVATLHTALPQLNGVSYKAASIDAGAAIWDNYLADTGPLEDKAGLFGAATLKAKTKKGCITPVHDFFPVAQALLDAEAALDELFRLHRLALFRTLLQHTVQTLQARKRERRLTTYDDLLQNLHRALHGIHGDQLAATLLQRYPAALIDEFQDTDPLQFDIFWRIYAPCAGAQPENAETPDGPLFLVGDPKQAIYSFRQADLHTYLRARQAIPDCYALKQNQRSDAGLIAAVNHLFGRQQEPFMLAGLDFNPVEAGEKPRKAFTDSSHGAHRPDTTALYLWQLPAQDPHATLDNGQPAPLLRHSAITLSAQACASEIARLLRAGATGHITIDGKPLRPADIAVLVRTHNQGKRMKRELAERGIIAAELSHANVFHTDDAEELERLLGAIAEPARIDRLRAALSTSLAGLRAHALVQLEDDEAGLTRWIERLQDWQERWLQRGIIFALRRIFDDLQLPARLLAAPDGERRLTNLRQLGELLHHAEQEHAGPVALLRWLADARQNDSEEDSRQMRLESDEGLVRIVTIHKSKGLEYPVVFCPFLFEGGIRSRHENMPGTAYHRPDGTAVIDFCDDDETGTGKAAAKRDHAAEVLRLYYVALTRAVHRAYLPCGTYASLGRSGKPSFTESGKALLNWLVAGGGKRGEAAETIAHAANLWLDKDKGGASPDAIRQAWQGHAESVAGESPAAVRLCPLPPHPAAAPLPPAIDHQQLSAREAGPRHYQGWRIDSFTGLMRGATSNTLAEAAASDHDAHQQISPPPSGSTDAAHDNPPPLTPTDILNFPRGAQAGDCIHQVFEQADFTRPETWETAIANALQSHPPAARETDPEKAQATLWPAMLQQMLAQVLDTPLPGGIRLATLPRTARLVELEFELPAPYLTADALYDTLSLQGFGLPTLNFRPLSGWLRGFIDLIFVHNGRYHVLDWKSNHLGDTPAAYGPAAVTQAMSAHGYMLQGWLYCVALHRFLQQRLPDYDPACHLGGIHYLFVRGVRPDWKNPDGSASGVWYQPADPERLKVLDRLLQRGG